MKKIIFVLVGLLAILALLYGFVFKDLKQNPFSKKTVLSETQLTEAYNRLMLDQKLALKYDSYEAAVQAVEKFTGLDSLVVKSINVASEGTDADATPYFVLSGELDRASNLCIGGTFNLVRGTGELYREPCVVE